MSKLKLHNVNKQLGGARILRDVSLDIAAGEFVVFVGPSGCGKSTLLRLIAGLDSICGGDLLIDGRRVNDLEPRERGVGMVFQSYALYPHMTVYDNISFGLKLAKTEKTSLRERVLKTAQILQLDKLLQRKPKELSGGQRQRVAMGRAMAREPDILLFDEPLSNLDASLRVQMRNEIARLHARLGSTVIYVTHDQVEAMTLADKIVVLNGGRIEQVGSPRELYERPASRFVAGFLGSPRMNFLAAFLHAPGETSLVESFVLGKVSLPFDSSGLAADTQLSLGIRPEHMTLEAAPGSAGVVVTGVEYLGSETYVHVDTGQDEPLICRCEVNAGWQVGDRVTLRLETDNLHLFDTDGVALKRHALETLPDSVPLHPAPAGAL
ncbi:sn-glycerol-3-phosphate ABC transporter ATP-binding protein UgpC [Pseudomonas corrugata]|uniref:ABC transporter domain-containing protein n=1 Tax=Pseudomonas corrugata TaxID=47879 RepID=A0A3M3EK26_9PSED|nr:sn-glycerol-3-phosphate ABC transporter ATP-binding protein UgpC [Pseudomonas corrugata]AOE60749.1 ABC transporter [Pseudomonas corrugata]MDU9021944.1 sn-glycerol-3-phosphate ABC transporter ATP-binding protein UgpC [Pseudomonas corrugata]MDU9032331.1 sn-glycerol-3-phosphate ABC transporter ATP-binding protein UgpC [Pseudomonas corrugata]MDU9037871.1 sn-glycerol-3-phosphate ABC transporter ATP-binding protein UgpC [Pseudomonas corrugata]QTH11897.1 sn-glycerol-3-phosphate ABC transporter ATP